MSGATFDPVFRLWAMRYAERLGWHVFPLVAREKTPATPNGFKDATNDPELVRALWGEVEFNVGLATGPASGVFVLDVDGGEVKGGGIPGPEALALLEEAHGSLPPTMRVNTGNGWHLYWRWPADRPLRNRARIRVNGERTGLDVRAEGGYVVLPPSVHPSGLRYRVVEGDPRELAEAPAWLLDLLDPPVPVKAPAPQAAPSPVDAQPSSDTEAYGRAALRTAVERIHGAAEGDRHGALYREAAALGELVAGGVLDAGTVEAALVAAGLAVGKGHAEVARTVRQGMEKGTQQPRTPPPRQPVGGGGPQSPGPSYRPTDAGNADRLADRFGDSARWSEGVVGDGWLVWDGARWAPDAMRQLDRLTRLVAGDVVVQAQQLGQQLRALQAASSSPPTAAEQARIAALRAEAKIWEGWARQSEMVGHLKAMQVVARERVAVDQARLDADPWQLNTPDGIVRLTDGQLLAHDREAMHTKVTGATPAGACPTWIAFLTRIMGGDASMVAFLQRVVGYCLTGSTREQAIFILYGNGSNGKSTFLDTLRAVLGDYVVHARAETFMRDARGGGIPNDVAALRGARLVTASEPEQGEQLDEGLVKTMTGDAALTARFMRGEFFTFQPRFKVLLATNHRPVIRGTDHGIWRRIRLVPFTEVISDAEKDRELPAKLMAEAAGILAWAVEGCLAWQRDGLAPPDAVVAATDDYRTDMDVLGEFLAERCVLGAGQTVGNTQLYEAFQTWQTANGEKPRSHRWLTRALQDRGYRQAASRITMRRWEGIGLRVEEVPRIKEARAHW